MLEEITEQSESIGKTEEYEETEQTQDESIDFTEATEADEELEEYEKVELQFFDEYFVYPSNRSTVLINDIEKLNDAEDQTSNSKTFEFRLNELGFGKVNH